MSDGTEVRSAGTFGALRIRYFPRMLASGWTWGLSRWGVSFIGPFVANELTGSARMVQLAGVAMWSPLLLGGVIGGWISDRFDRRRTVITQFLVTIPSLTLLGLAGLADRLEIWMIYPILFVVGVGWLFDMTGRRAIVYDLVGPLNVDNAMALESMGTSTGLAIGALAGGTLIQAAGVGWALLAMAGFQLVSLVAFAAVPRVERQQPATVGGAREVVQGFRMLRTEMGLVSVLGVTAVVNFFFFSGTPLIQVLGGKYDVGPALLGLLAAMLGFGMFAGSLAIAHFQPNRRGGAYVSGSYLALVFMLAFAVAPAYVAAAAALFVAAAGMGAFGSTQAVLVMAAVDSDKRGRALGLLSTAIGVLPLGMLLLGEIAEALSPTQAIVLSVLIGGVLMTLFLPVRPECLSMTSDGVAPTPRRSARRAREALAPAVFTVVHDDGLELTAR